MSSELNLSKEEMESLQAVFDEINAKLEEEHKQKKEIYSDYKSIADSYGLTLQEYLLFCIMEKLDEIQYKL